MLYKVFQELDAVEEPFGSLSSSALGASLALPSPSRTGGFENRLVADCPVSERVNVGTKYNGVMGLLVMGCVEEDEVVFGVEVDWSGVSSGMVYISKRDREF